MNSPICLEAISKMPNGSFDHLDKLGIFNRLMTLSNIEGPISASGLNHNPRNNEIKNSEYRIQESE